MAAAAKTPAEKSLEMDRLLEGAGGREQPGKSGRRMLAAVATTVLAVVGVLALTLIRPGSGGFLAQSAGMSSSVVSLAEDAPSYYVMIDCGSSGTRLKIFKLEDAKIKEVLVQEKIEMDALSSYVERLTDLEKEKMQVDALSNYIARDNDLESDLREMVNKSKQYVPEASQAQTQLIMYATAGMRVLPAEDQHAVFAQCCNLLRDKSFSPYQFHDARTMSGEMEAVFSYLSVNYVKTGEVFPAEPVGQIEMGGASLQVAFHPKDIVLDNSWVYDLLGKRKIIYAKSYMGYGQNLARLKTQEAAVRAALPKGAASGRRLTQNSSKALSDGVVYPCFLKGYKETVKVFEGTPEERDVVLNGSSDFEACAELTQQILHNEYECELKPCAFHGVYMPKVSGKFVGISGFKYALMNMGLDLGSTTPGQMRESLKKFCGQTFADLGSHSKYTKTECFLGNYAYSMLRALGFGDDSTDISFAGDYSWTLGAAVYQAFGPDGSHSSSASGTRRLSELPGVQSVPPMDHKCYWSCRSRRRCGELASGPGGACKRACSAGCAA